MLVIGLPSSPDNETPSAHHPRPIITIIHIVIVDRLCIHEGDVIVLLFVKCLPSDIPSSEDTFICYLSPGGKR